MNHVKEEGREENGKGSHRRSAAMKRTRGRR
jgi:hypothetical protein